MHHVTSSATAGTTSIEVDGSLDVVAAYDLWRRVMGLRGLPKSSGSTSRG